MSELPSPEHSSKRNGSLGGENERALEQSAENQEYDKEAWGKLQEEYGIAEGSVAKGLDKNGNEVKPRVLKIDEEKGRIIYDTAEGKVKDFPIADLLKAQEMGRLLKSENELGGAAAEGQVKEQGVVDRAGEIAGRLERGERLDDIVKELKDDDPVLAQIRESVDRFKSSDLDLGFSPKALVVDGLRNMKEGASEQRNEGSQAEVASEVVGEIQEDSEELPEELVVAARAESVLKRINSGEDLQQIVSGMAPDDPVLAQVNEWQSNWRTGESYGSKAKYVADKLEQFADRERKRFEKRRGAAGSGKAAA